MSERSHAAELLPGDLLGQVVGRGGEDATQPAAGEFEGYPMGARDQNQDRLVVEKEYERLDDGADVDPHGRCRLFGGAHGSRLRGDQAVMSPGDERVGDSSGIRVQWPGHDATL